MAFSVWSKYFCGQSLAPQLANTLFKEAGKSLLSILNDILDFSKIEAGRLEISNCEFDPTSLIEGVGEILSPRPMAKIFCYRPLLTRVFQL